VRERGEPPTAISSFNTAGKLCVLMEVATFGGWRDVYPLVENVMKWQANRVTNENDNDVKLLPTFKVLKFTFNEANSNYGSPRKQQPTAKSNTKKIKNSPRQ
jgi:hypothetical protein